MDSTEKINTLFRLLLRIHKSLIDFQKLILEALDQKKYSAYDMLQFAFNHPDFEWLRKISTIMADMDESTSDKKNPPDEARLKEFVRRLDEIFGANSAESEFERKLNIALERDSKLAAEVAHLRDLLEEVLK